LRVYPGAVVDIYTSGTDTLIDSVVADANGYWSVATLASGKYDIKVDGNLVRTLHFVKADHSHSPDETWVFFHSGALSADSDAVNTRRTFGSDVVGSLIKVKVQAHYVDATGDATVHLLKGASGGGTNLVFASDSVWSHQINPGSAEYRYLYADNSPGVSLAADDVIQLGLDHTATSVQGITVVAIFRPT
jgi:hypothetical protein